MVYNAPSVSFGDGCGNNTCHNGPKGYQNGIVSAIPLRLFQKRQCSFFSDTSIDVSVSQPVREQPPQDSLLAINVCIFYELIFTSQLIYTTKKKFKYIYWQPVVSSSMVSKNCFTPPFLFEIASFDRCCGITIVHHTYTVTIKTENTPAIG